MNNGIIRPSPLSNTRAIALATAGDDRTTDEELRGEVEHAY